MNWAIITNNDNWQTVKEFKNARKELFLLRNEWTWDIKHAHTPMRCKYLRYEFGAPPFLNFLWVSHSIKGRHNGESLFWQRIPAATSIINAILPIISAELALFGVCADDLFSRWRALRGFRSTLSNLVYLILSQ